MDQGVLESSSETTARNAFEDYIASDGVVEAWDPMPDEYRAAVTRVVAFQALAEIVGTSLFTPWLDRAPTLLRKSIMAAKVQDELGHAQVLLRVLEDLGMTRDELIEGYLAGQKKLLSVFHYEIDRWEEFPIQSVMGTTAAMGQFRSLVKGSYMPYVRALKKIIREESFHFHQAVDLTDVLVSEGTNRQFQSMQEAVDKWFPIMLTYYGPSDRESVHTDELLKWRIKVDSNDSLRQRWLGKIVPLLRRFGFSINDAKLSFDDRTGRWEYTEPDWAEVKRVIAGGGPASAERHRIIKEAWERNRWIREALASERTAAA